MPTRLPPDITSAGEYGATRVTLTKDGSSYRIATGRSGAHGNEVYFGAFTLSKEAFESLKQQIAELEE